MKKPFWLFLFCLIAFITAYSQHFDAVADKAFLISRMAEKYHVQPRATDAAFSEAWFTSIMNSIDDERLFFTQGDINQLNKYRFQLHQQLLQKKTGFLEELFNLYQIRLKQVDSMVAFHCNQPFNLDTKEQYTVKEDTAYATDLKALNLKLKKHLQASLINHLVEWNEDADSMDVKSLRKYDDSLEIVIRKKIKSSYQRFIKRKLESPGGLAEGMGNMYCKTLATSYDPHTNYFPLTEKENFESSLGNTKKIFGFTLDEDDDGQVTIDHLKPGSSAFKSGQLNSGDKITGLQWENQANVDVSDATAAEISRMMDASNDKTLTITIKKADGTFRQVTLAKEKEEEDPEDDGRVKSFILKGVQNIGFISLPSFYTDWQNSEKGDEGCANDISKEILKLKKENIAGLIIDLRFNGGGSLKEATDLSGIFIDYGPVAQLCTKEGKAYSVKDVNRGTIFDGPLLLLVNGYSASASEAVAGTLQDYHRAIIAGTPTFGKATAQIVMPLDTTIVLDEFDPDKAIKTDSYLKLTIEKVYRVSGNTAQQKGVIPDILLPEPRFKDTRRETTYKNSLFAANIEPNKYYKPLPATDYTRLQAFAKTLTDTTAFFKKIALFNHLKEIQDTAAELPLSLAAGMAASKKSAEQDKNLPDFDSDDMPQAPYTVDNHSYEKLRLQSDKDLSELNDSWKLQLAKDPYIQAAYRIISFTIQ
jgi:carboxyl-terminal processing protease